MFCLDLTLAAPAENLALDEALLGRAESDGFGETLRFWEPTEHFVVVGYANRVSTEVNVEFCATNHIPIYRRCTGGGTDLQGPGVLNYSLILRADAGSACATVHSANAFIMERNRRAALRALQHSSVANAGGKQTVELEGCTDLAINGKKFNGNAQRRRQKYLLFHGSFLLSADLARIEATLRMPSKQPKYRSGRTHQEFLMNLPVAGTELKAALVAEWQATAILDTPLDSALPPTVRERYQSSEWNLKFP